MKKSFSLKPIALAMLGLGAVNAVAQETGQTVPSTRYLEEVVVTAQKRQQSINDVPMSITAATGEQLKQAGVRDVSDLVKITPGLSYGVSTTGTPVYSLRGVGYNDAALSTRPAVTVYLDEAPMTFVVETRGATLDVERVEVLKGPQGTLFGNNSTGGAINYIAAKPTSEFAAGVNVSYDRFNELSVDGYVSGPLSETLSARLAVERRDGGDWQKSYTHGGEAGEADFTNARAILLWEPSDDLTTQLTLSHWTDKSDTQRAQAHLIREQVPGLLPLTGLVDYPIASNNNRSADWNPEADLVKDNEFSQATVRIDYNLSETLTLTSLSTYIDYEQYVPSDTDGTSVFDIQVDSIGSIDSFAQELRLSATFDRLSALVGVNYSKEEPQEDLNVLIPSSTVALSFAGFGSPLSTVNTTKDEEITGKAIFANIEYEATSQLKLQAGIRYSETKDEFTGCSNDTGDGAAAIAVGGLLNLALRPAFGLDPIPAIQPGECVTFNPATLEPTLINNKLDEDNVSWRLGAQYELTDDTMLYANISQGYKAGGFASLTAFIVSGLDPAVEESVLAYEVGFKTSLLDRKVQLNGAAFYYDYEDKQVTGTVLDPILGPISKLVNVPTATIYGAELELTAMPVEGLMLTLAGSYTKSSVDDHYTSFDSLGTPNVDFDGTALPFAPKVQVSASARYEWPLSDALYGFVGANASHQSKTWSDLGEVPLTQIDAYTLVDLQAGLGNSDGSWTAYAWGRNVFDEFYLYNSVRLVDTAGRFTGRPATYGVTLSYNF